ncbi:MAG TPA: dihydropteroate synthase, partial [Thiolinea sp.]|nr:dihydropteroate synthase [Thiolinea sp.]
MFDLSLPRTQVMGILNVTPDSFSDGGRFYDLDTALRQTERMVQEGVDIIDIGGESTRPCAQDVSVDEELDRVLPVIAAIRERFDIPISVDTSKPEVMQTALQYKVEVIND